MEEIRQCSRCILPETYPKIRFDEEGLCNICLNHKPVPVMGEENLRKILRTRRGEIYDCVVPISGGKDSALVLYYSVKILKLRVIAVNYDSGFQIDLARENTVNICKTLNVPLIIVKANPGTQRAMLKEALLVSEIIGDFFSMCGNCETNIKTVSLNTAKKYGIPFILYGSSRFEETGDQPFKGMEAFIRKVPKRNTHRVLYHMARYCFNSILQRSQMKVPLRYRFHPTYVVPFPKSKIQAIPFFDFVEWDSINKADFLKKELGWKYPENQPDRFDCMLHCFSNYRWLKATGITLDGFNHSMMIRENHLSRDIAILFEKILQDNLENTCRKTIKTIGLTEYKMPDL